MNVRVITLHGVPRQQWCDTCLRTHAWIRVYRLDRPDAPPTDRAVDREHR